MSATNMASTTHCHQYILTAFFAVPLWLRFQSSLYFLASHSYHPGGESRLHILSLTLDPTTHWCNLCCSCSWLARYGSWFRVLYTTMQSTLQCVSINCALHSLGCSGTNNNLEVIQNYQYLFQLLLKKQPVLSIH